MKDFLEKYGFWLAVSAALATTGLLAALCVQADQKEADAFMLECGRDHKHYECEIMWRNSDHKSTVIAVPVVVSK